MDRRRFIGAVAAALIARSYPGEAQQGEKVFRIGFLSLNSADSARDALAAFRQVLQERGWVGGQNIGVEFRFAEGDVDRLPALATELTRLGVDVIVTGSSVATRAAKDATKTIPIVMAASADALGEGVRDQLGAAQREHHRGDLPCRNRNRRQTTGTTQGGGSDRRPRSGAYESEQWIARSFCEGPESRSPDARNSASSCGSPIS
jgi:ABC-type uncharacterized transport system, periplasmic component